MENDRGLNRLAQQHYENFPVASRFIAKKYRRPIHLLYAFARVGDDIADEWTGSREARLLALDVWSRQLHTAVDSGRGTDFFLDLAGAVRDYRLDLTLFDDLIEAFRMDVRHAGYPTYADLLCYCRHSANPVGRLMLQIFDCATQQNCELSDTLCTALQLANFWQDLLIDTERLRYYIPAEDCVRFGVTRGEWRDVPASKAVRALVEFEVERTKSLFQTGRPLLDRVPRSFRLELRLIWHGGMGIVRKIERQNYDTLSHRPVLSSLDKAAVFCRALASR
jgi:squalene synthase HpnC